MTKTGGRGVRRTGTGLGGVLMGNVRKAALVLLTAMAIASLPGCGGDSPGSEATGAAVTRGAATSTDAGTTSNGGAPSDSPGGTAGAPKATSGEARLSDTGLGDLKLNMTLKKARSLGWVGKPALISGEHFCDTYHGKRGTDLLYFTHDRLVIIAVGPKIKLDTGLGVGDTYAELHGAYGDRLGSSSGDPGGRVTIEAPGAPFEAVYRIGIDTGPSYRDSKVTEIALQSVNLGCYE